jgi:hypothetical protein
MSKSYLDQIQQKFSNKSQQYWAQMRTNLLLSHRSDKVDEITINTITEELHDILDSGILTYPQTLTQVGIEPGMSLKDKKQELGLRTDVLNHNEDEKIFLKNMSHKADVVRKSNWAWRIGQEAEEKRQDEWYPFFVTLTVDPQLTDPKKLWQDGRAFRKYIRRLVNIVCKELGEPPAHKPPYRSESQYVTYAGVIEHGKSREHHHGHFIIWLRAIPPSWRTCPNKGIRNPANRKHNECLPMRTLWGWSLPHLSPALYFRHVADIYQTNHQFCLPLDKSGRPMKVSTPRTSGFYITKYLSKEHKEWHHRMKATRNLGINTLRAALSQLDQMTVEALTWRAPSSTTNLFLMRIHMVPLGLLRSVAKRQLYLMKFRQKQLTLSELITSNSSTFTKMLSSVRSGARPDRMDSSQFYDWVSQLLPEQIGYSDTKALIANTFIGTIFPREKLRVKSIKIGANEIGHP